MATDTVCINPECNKNFKRKSSKKKHCCLSCKNRAGYLRDLDKNKDDIIWQKSYENNKRIIDDLYERNKVEVPLIFLEFMGFNFNTLKEKQYINEGKTAYYIIGNYFIVYKTDNLIQIQSKLKNQNQENQV